MIEVSAFYQALKQRGVNFFSGVPDSLLKHFCAYLESNCDLGEHIIAANEGNAIALGVGTHLATGGIPLIYLQNSGLGNVINPLLSLADREVYSIPMLLLIGWRGEPGIKDEPQHIKQGRVQNALLDAMEIPWQILSEDYESRLDELFEIATKESRPVALVVRKDSFAKYSVKKCDQEAKGLVRERALDLLLVLLSDAIDENYLLVSTTGKTSRELYELRQGWGEDCSDFLTVGSMGHASSIALGVALKEPDKKVICLDGDGAMLMHLGALATIGKAKPKNFIHILLNNGCHESVGGQETAASAVDMAALAKAAGYHSCIYAESEQEIKEAMRKVVYYDGPVFFEIKVASGSREDLGRPKSSPIENKQAFINRARK